MTGTGETVAHAQVLLVEDSPGDIRLAQEAFRAADHDIAVHVVTDGVEAMAFLRQEGEHRLAPRPDLVLLDLNLPKMDGREVLALVKGDDDLKSIPILILTTSEADIDVTNSYRLHVNCYLCKSTHLDAFETLMRSLIDFWLTRATLPLRSVRT